MCPFGETHKFTVVKYASFDISLKPTRLGVKMLRQLWYLADDCWSWGQASDMLISQYRDIHYTDVIMGAMAYQITSLTIVYSTVYSGADERKHQSPAPLAFVQEIQRGPVKSPHKWPVALKLFPFDDVIMVKTTGQWFKRLYLIFHVNVVLHIIAISLSGLVI